MTPEEVVKSVVGQVMEETDGVKNYITCFLNWKDKDKTISKLYYDMASQELEHAKKVATVLDYVGNGSNPEMAAVVEFIKPLITDQIHNASVCVSLYKS